MSKPMKINSTNPKYRRSVHRLLCLGALCGATLSVGAVAAVLQPYEKLSKQLTIMNDIFISSLQAQSDNALKNTKISALYLSGQGAVFTVKSSSGFDWNNRSFSFSFSDRVLPSVPLVDEIDFSFFDASENSNKMAEKMRSASEQQRERAREFSEHQRRLASDVRDLERAKRELEREKRDLEYQMRAVNKNEKKALAEQKEAINKQKAELEKTQAVLAEKSQKMQQQQKVSKEKKLAKRKQYYQKLSMSLVETLCTYGNSLKALPKGEHVNIVLKSAGNRVGRSYQDKILVLTKRNINACVMDEISAEKLLSSTGLYQF